MHLSLSPTDRARFTAAQQALLARPDAVHPDALDRWRFTVNDRLKMLLGAEAAVSEMPREVASRPVVSEEYTTVPPAEYLALFWPLAQKHGVTRRLEQRGVLTRPQLWGAGWEEYLRSPYYNEFLLANRMLDSLTLSAPVWVEGKKRIAQVILHRNSATAPPFGSRERALAGLLLPAFRAGLAAHARAGEALAEATRALDALGVARALVDRAGRTLHQTPALVTLLAAEPEAARVADALQAAVRAATGVIAGRVGGQPALVVATTRAAYRVHAAIAPDGSFGAGPTVLVTVDPVDTPGHEPLTVRERSVLGLLAEGRTQKQIAEALFLSPATVNGHLQKVYEKLGVHTAHGAVARAFQERLL